jgi:hypothetical protein
MLIKRQVSVVQQTLKYNLVQQSPMPDSLYQCLKKYGYKQYVITDAIEYFYAILVQYNIHSYYRFFIFDMTSKSLSFYEYWLDGITLSPNALSNPPRYTWGRNNGLYYLKSYNNKIERAYKSSLEGKK